MRLSPTTTLALALAAGLAVPALAQTTATPSTGAGTMSPGATSPGATSPGTMSPGTTSPGTTTQQPASALHSDRQAPVPGQAMGTDENRVRQAQDQLHAAGLYNGPIDGIMGPDTRAALTRFQMQSGLQRTDTLDDQTFARLMNAKSGAPATMGSGSSTPGMSGASTSTTPGAGDASTPSSTAPSAPGTAGGMAPSGSTHR